METPEVAAVTSYHPPWLHVAHPFQTEPARFSSRIGHPRVRVGFACGKECSGRRMLTFFLPSPGPSEHRGVAKEVPDHGVELSPYRDELPALAASPCRYVRRGMYVCM